MSATIAPASPAAQGAPDQGAVRACGATWHSTRARDADELASQLTGWDQQYDQLSCGRFDGELAELRLEHLQLFRERISHAVSQSCTVRSDAIWIGLPDVGRLPRDAIAPIRIDGQVNPGHQAMVRAGGQPFELLTPDAHRIFGIVVEREALARAAASQESRLDVAGLLSQPLLEVDAATRAELLELIETALACGDGERMRTPAAALPALQAVLMEGVVRLLDRGAAQGRPARQSLARRRQVVAKAREHVLAHRDRALTVPELCEHVHVSRRTLQYCFEDVLGVGPLQYLRALRLNAARRELRGAAGRRQSVQDVAARWGFWHFSQFASDYRRLFDETPSATLKAGGLRNTSTLPAITSARPASAGAVQR